jgi:hypothetical protein
MLVDRTGRSGPMGPDEPSNGQLLGVIGRWTGRVAEPGSSRLPVETAGNLPSSEPLRERVPLFAGFSERCMYEPLDETGMESLGGWLSRSDAHVAEYVDSILLSAMLEETLRMPG